VIGLLFVAAIVLLVPLAHFAGRWIAPDITTDRKDRT